MARIRALSAIGGGGGITKNYTYSAGSSDGKTGTHTYSDFKKINAVGLISGGTQAVSYLDETSTLQNFITSGTANLAITAISGNTVTFTNAYYNTYATNILISGE